MEGDQVEIFNQRHLPRNKNPNSHEVTAAAVAAVQANDFEFSYNQNF